MKTTTLLLRGGNTSQVRPITRAVRQRATDDEAALAEARRVREAAIEAEAEAEAQAVGRHRAGTLGRRTF
jgi:hypothetical protein